MDYLEILCIMLTSDIFGLRFFSYLGIWMTKLRENTAVISGHVLHLTFDLKHLLSYQVFLKQ